MTQLLRELSRFGLVGVIATMIHAGMYILCLGFIAPQFANLIGFLSAAGFSYLGHSRFSFSDVRTKSCRRPALRFMLVALFGYALNSGFVELTRSALGWPASYGVFFIVFVTPVLVFVALKFWVFQKSV